MSSNTGRGLGWAEFIGIVLLLVLLGAVLLPTLTDFAQPASRRKISCQNNLKQMGIVFKMYSGENRDYLPRLQGPDPWYVDGTIPSGLGDACNADDQFDWTFNPPSVYPEYLTDWAVLECPDAANPNLKVIESGCDYASMASNADASYIYLGYLFDRANADDASITPEDMGNGTSNMPVQLHEFVRLATHLETSGPSEHAYRDLAKVLENDLKVAEGTGNAGGKTIYRLKEGVQRILNPESDEVSLKRLESRIPTMWDIPSRNHTNPAGGNVLFLDGHAEFIPSTPGSFFPINANLENAFVWVGILP